MLTHNDCLVTLTAAVSDLNRLSREMKSVRDAVGECKQFILGEMTRPKSPVQQPPSETSASFHLGEVLIAVEALFKESTDWGKSCSSTSNWFDHSPAAQKLKNLLKHFGRPA